MKSNYMLETPVKQPIPKSNKSVVGTISRQDFTPKITKELAYLFGVYLTDGSVTDCNFQLQVIDKDFAERTLSYIKSLVPTKASIRIRTERTSWNKSDRYVIKAGLGRCLADYFRSETNNKHHLPYWIHSANNGLKRWFIAGIMDGDGWISATKRQTGEMFQYRIGIGGVEEGWIHEFRDLLSSLGVKNNKIERVRTETGIMFSRFNINPGTFFKAKLFFTIERKQKRCEIASTTIRSTPVLQGKDIV